MAGSSAAAEKIPQIAALDDAGFQHFYNLEYDDALRIFTDAAARRPSADTYNHIAQTILYRAMFRAGALDSRVVADTHALLHLPKVAIDDEDRRQFQESIGRAIEMAQARLDENRSDTDALYALGVSYGLRGNYDFAVRKAYLDSLKAISAARKLHNRATEADPSFIDARLTQGLHDYIAGSLPAGWKMMGFLTGFHGERERGIRTLKLVAKEGRINRIDAQVMLAAIYRREKKPAEAAALLEELAPQFPRNFLLRLDLADVYADMGDARAALKIIADVERMKAEGEPGYGQLAEGKIRNARERVMNR